VRIIVVRGVYASKEFDWDITRGRVLGDMEECSVALLAEHLASSLGASPSDVPKA